MTRVELFLRRQKALFWFCLGGAYTSVIVGIFGPATAVSLFVMAAGYLVIAWIVAWRNRSTG